MSVSKYLNPDFTLGKKLIFLLLTFVLIGISLSLIYASVLLTDKKCPSEGSRRSRIYRGFVDKSQRFFEMIIAGTSVLSFSCSYVIINHLCDLINSGAAGRLTSTEQMLFDAWTEGKDFVLLLLICLSCVINTILDTFILPLKKITREEKATIRMLAMFYVIIILMYLNYIGDESQYSPVMMYYFGLMVGRFVYFDASFKDFLNALRNMFFNLPYLLVTLLLIGALCLFGFNMGYLLERNYYIMGVFYTHLFILICIFIIHICWIIYDKTRRAR